jgi:hypothetical protein
LFVGTTQQDRAAFCTQFFASSERC